MGKNGKISSIFLKLVPILEPIGSMEPLVPKMNQLVPFG